MSDPGWSTAEAAELHEDLGFPLTLGSMAKSLELFFHPQNGKYLVDHLDKATKDYINTWRVTACTPGLDTDDDGCIWPKVLDETPGAGQVTIEFYRGPACDGSAGDELVATAVGNNSATLEIEPEAGYTFAGTVDVEVIGVALADHEFVIHVQVPPAQRIAQLFNGDHSYDELIRTAALRCVADMRTSFRRAKERAAQLAEFVERTEIEPTLVVRTGDQLLSLGVETLRGGAIQIAPTGLLVDHKAAMAANTGTAGVMRAAAGAWSGSIAFPGAWQGKASAVTYNQRCRPATLTLACTKKLGGNPPQLTVRRACDDPRYRPNDDGTGLDQLGDRLLTIGADWSAPEWGIDSLRIDYKPSVSGVTNNGFSATTTDWAVTGLTTENSTEGVVYPRFDGSAVKIYKTAAGRTAQDTSALIATAALAATAINTVFVATGATCTVTGKTGNGNGTTLTTGSVADVDFQAPTVSGGSRAILEISETTTPGSWVAAWRDGLIGGVGAEVHTAATPNLKAGWAERACPMTHVGVSGARA